MDLLEREPQWQRVNETIKGVAAGEGAIVLVSGEAGIGKTSFVKAIAKSFQPPARVLWGACDPLFTPRPLGPIYDIAMGGFPHLLDRLNAGADWLATAAELHKILMESQAPTLLVFEDIHWADEATLDLVKYLGRRIQQTKTLLILTYREDEAGSKRLLRSVLGDLPPQCTTRLPLGALSEEAVGILALKMNRPASGIYEVTRGNPFFVTEVLRNDTSDLPATVRDAVLARLTHLPAPARDLLELASIIPGAAEGWLLEETAQPAPAALDACIEGGFLVPSGETLTFHHELVRLAIEESLAMGRKKELHRSVLQSAASATRRGDCAGEAGPSRGGSRRREQGARIRAASGPAGQPARRPPGSDPLLPGCPAIPSLAQARRAGATAGRILLRKLPDRANRRGHPGAPGGRRSLAAGRRVKAGRK